MPVITIQELALLNPNDNAPVDVIETVNGIIERFQNDTGPNPYDF